MLRIKIPLSPEGWDEEKREFIEPEVQILELEHSLVSISDWESKWCKSFLACEELTYDETLDYIKCMTLNKNIDPDLYMKLTTENIDEIRDYIYSPMTATTVTENKTGRSRKEIVTSELIYYWMIDLGIPFECERWHLNRLIMLIKVCQAKNSNPKKMNKRDLMNQHAAINAANRARFNSRG